MLASSFARLLMRSAEVKRVVLAGAAVTQQVPLREMVCDAVLVPAHVVRLVSEVALTDAALQHPQVTPALVVLPTDANHQTY